MDKQHFEHNGKEQALRIGILATVLLVIVFLGYAWCIYIYQALILILFMFTDLLMQEYVGYACIAGVVVLGLLFIYFTRSLIIDTALDQELIASRYVITSLILTAFLIGESYGVLVLRERWSKIFAP